jgi:hypothetical protein
MKKLPEGFGIGFAHLQNSPPWEISQEGSSTLHIFLGGQNHD